VKCLVTAFFFMLFGTLASAQSLPERYMVADVASDDVLNVRAEPAASSEIIGKLGPDTLNVEVLRTLDGWGYVGAGERSSWVSMRFLAPNPPAENKAPRPMSSPRQTTPLTHLTHLSDVLPVNDRKRSPILQRKVILCPVPGRILRRCPTAHNRQLSRWIHVVNPRGAI
jgi:hypothetical protein